MSGPYPLTRSPSAKPVVTDPDEALCLLSALVTSEMEWDAIEPEVNRVFDALLAAGYVEEWGQSPTGLLWAITDAGQDRLAALGRN